MQAPLRDWSLVVYKRNRINYRKVRPSVPFCNPFVNFSKLDISFMIPEKDTSCNQDLFTLMLLKVFRFVTTLSLCC